ncbi:MAG: NADH:ubiquinone reductase (Na(+)-transporting) subunit C [Bacteroidota bacterium]
MDSTGSVLRFTLIMCAITSLLLAGLFYSTKERAKQNEAIFNKRAILSAVSTYLDENPKEMSDERVLEIFDNQVEQTVLNMDGKEVDADAVKAAGHKGGRAEDIDMKKEKKKPEEDRLLPMFIFNSDSKKFYIVSVRGNGLWDEIWGNIAIESDFNTVAGATFDHVAETPGLGAEIKDNPAFKAQFSDLKLYDDDGDYVSITVRKGGAKDQDHEVDGISGATVTCDGVTEMLDRGIKYYEPYFAKLRGTTTSKPVGLLSK